MEVRQKPVHWNVTDLMYSHINVNIHVWHCVKISVSAWLFIFNDLSGWSQVTCVMFCHVFLSYINIVLKSMTANAAMTWIVHFTWMSYVVFHHWTDTYIYFLVYDMRELNSFGFRVCATWWVLWFVVVFPNIVYKNILYFKVCVYVLYLLFVFYSVLSMYPFIFACINTKHLKGKPFDL